MEHTQTEDGTKTTNGQVPEGTPELTNSDIYWDKKECHWVLSRQDMTVSYGQDGGDHLHIYVEQKGLRRYMYHYFEHRGSPWFLEGKMKPSTLSSSDVEDILDQSFKKGKVYIITDLGEDHPTEWALVAWSGDSKEYDPDSEILTIILSPVGK